VTAATVLVNVVLNILLVREVGYLGLAAGTSIAAILNAAMLVALLRRRLGGLEGGRLLVVFGRTTAATVVMSLATYALMGALAHVLPGPALPLQVARLALAIAGGMAVLAVTAWAVGLREFTDVLRALSSRFLGAGRR
jgi:putative peptidoglycan lipid II flippase